MSEIARDARVWLNRMSECRNPLYLGLGVKYDFERRAVLELATGQSYESCAAYLREIEDDFSFINGVREKLSQWTIYKPRHIDFMMTGWPPKLSGSVFFNEVTIYAMVRALKPEVMIETGGTPGKSTAFILRAMERNDKGHLYTIDLPPQTIEQSVLAERGKFHELMPAGASSNWVVPESLRQRHTLLLGKSSDHLPSLLKQLDRVDIFFHDSDHSYENMTWEFETAWAKIKPQGLLLTDDALANSSFFDFCGKENLRYAHVFNLGAARIR